MVSLEQQINKLLTKNQKTLAIAESCTGGLVSNFITNVAGSSRYFILGIVAYSNKAKVKVLRIPTSLLARKGAVSNQVAQKMAQSVRKIANADFGIGITGIAGPQGGSIEKPVGTVFIAVDSANKKICKKFHFKERRIAIKKQSAYQALKLLKLCLAKQ